MPINIPKNLPAGEHLREEKIFVMEEDRAKTQQIRPLNILILNLMPEKKNRAPITTFIRKYTITGKYYLFKYGHA